MLSENDSIPPTQVQGIWPENFEVRTTLSTTTTKQSPRRDSILTQSLETLLQYHGKSAAVRFHLDVWLERGTAGSMLLWRNFGGWQDVEKPSLAGTKTISLSLPLGSESASQISQAGRRPEVHPPSPSFAGRDAHRPVRAGLRPCPAGSPHPASRGSRPGAFSYLAPSGPRPPARLARLARWAGAGQFVSQAGPRGRGRRPR